MAMVAIMMEVDLAVLVLPQAAAVPAEMPLLLTMYLVAEMELMVTK